MYRISVNNTTERFVGGPSLNEIECSSYSITEERLLAFRNRDNKEVEVLLSVTDRVVVEEIDDWSEEEL